MSLFEYSNDGNKLRKKLSIHKNAVRSVEFDSTGKLMVSGSKDKSFKITDVVSTQESWKINKFATKKCPGVNLLNQILA